MSTLAAERWRPLIADILAAQWPALEGGVNWIVAQVQQESAGNPAAVSTAGARGLLQLMPGTAAELGVRNVNDPTENLRGGIKYLRVQFDRFPEIPDRQQRLFFAFGAFNGGRGYINRALELARLEGGVGGEWTLWDVAKLWLMHRACTVRGRYPDHTQIWTYVDRIRAIRGRLNG